MSPLSSDDRRALLELARRAIVEAVDHSRPLEFLPAMGALAQPGGAFVTLHRRGRLRGCVGQVEPAESLAQTVVRCAVASALEDARFPSVQTEEIADLEIEVSVLSPLDPITPEHVEVGRHGLYASRGGRRGLLLPQVAMDRRWTRERFLEETCLKAGLEPLAWKDPATLLLGFTAEVFSEAEWLAPREKHSG